MLLLASEYMPPDGSLKWIACAAFAIWFLNQGAAFIALFKTEAQKPSNEALALRVAALELGAKELREHIDSKLGEIVLAIAKRNEEGENRASQIHLRIDPLVEATGEIKGSLHAFTKSFESFTQIITGMQQQAIRRDHQ